MQSAHYIACTDSEMSESAFAIACEYMPCCGISPNTHLDFQPIPPWGGRVLIVAHVKAEHTLKLLLYSN